LIEAGDGVVDNWTGASLLSSLYQGLADVPRRHTFRFVSFSHGEYGHARPGRDRDRIEAVHIDEYYRTYRLVLAYLTILDQRLD